MEHSEGLLGFVVRAPSVGDGQGVADLIIAYDVGAYGSADYSVAALRDEWDQPCFMLETDAILVATLLGQIVGYAAVYDEGQHAHMVGDGYVHPAYCGRGIGTVLVRWVEQRARGLMDLSPQEGRVTLDQRTAGTDVAAATLFVREGYARVRTFWHMAIHLEASPTPTLPEGIVVRSFVPGRDEFAAYMAAEEAFQDHWGHVALPFEEWRATRIDREGFDPSLVFLAWDGVQVAGMIRCRFRGEGGSRSGWVDHLSVRRPWRGRGLGTALLLHAFATFYRRGVFALALGVDAESLTGATRLYERAGMHVERPFDVYQKTLRDGG